MPGNVPILHSIYTGNGEDSSILVLELDADNIWLVDSGFSRSPSYQYFRSAILKHKISNIKGIIITNTHAGRLNGITRFLKEFFSQDISTEESQKLDCLIILTKEFINEPIIDILKDNEFEIIHDFDDKKPIFESQNINLKCFFHDKGRPLILKRKRNVDQNTSFYEKTVRYVTTNSMVTNYVSPILSNYGLNNYVENSSLVKIFGLGRSEVKPSSNTSIERSINELSTNVQGNKSKAHADLSSILTCLQYTCNSKVGNMILTSDSIASWILEVVTIKLKEYQQTQLNERPFIDVFQVPNYGSRINSMVGTHVSLPQYVNQQFALMMILYYGGQFDFKDLDDKAAIETDFEIMCNFSNFEIFEEAAQSKGYIQTPSNLAAIKNFLKFMARALVIRRPEKDSNINWNWDEINWPEVGRKLYIIYKMNQKTKQHHWPKYDFIKDEVGISDEELDEKFDSYINNIRRGNITEKQLYVYFKSIKRRIRKNFDIMHKDLKPLLSSMWHCLKISPLSFRYIASSISNFYNSFITKTYIISSGSRHGHPDSLVLVGIIKSVLEDLNEEEREVMILLTNGSKINMNLLTSAIDDLLENKSSDIQKLLSKRIKVYTINDSAYEVSIKLSNGELLDPKSAQLLSWDSTGKEEIKKITDIFKRNKNLPSQPIDKKVIYNIKILNQDNLWLSVDKEGNLASSDVPVSFLISLSFPDQIAYQISCKSCNFIVKFEWVVEDKYDEFYLVDLNTEEKHYYAIDKSTTSPKFKKQPTKEGAQTFCFSIDDSINNSTDKKRSGKTLKDFLIELGELEKNEENTTLTIRNALNYIICTRNVEKIFESLPNYFANVLSLIIELDSEVVWEISKDNLFDIKNASIRPKKEELPKLGVFVTAMHITIKNPRLNNMEISMKINLNNNGSESILEWTPKITDISKTKPVHDYLLNTNVQQKKWRNISFGYLCLLMMPQLSVVPEFLKISLPFISSIALLDQKVNKEISEINFETGPTGAIATEAKFLLDKSMTGNMLDFQLSGIPISQITDVEIKITDPGAISGSPKISIDARANIGDKSVILLTQNDNMQSFIVEFDAGTTLTQVAKALKAGENIYDKFKVPLFDIPLSNFLENIQPEFSLLFYPVTEPPTMNFRLKNIRVFAKNNIPEIKNFVPSQIYERLTNTTIDISIFNPLETENITIGTNINFCLSIANDKKLLATLSYMHDKKIEQLYTLPQYMISIKPQSLDENNNTMKLREVLNAIDLFETLEELSEFAPMLWKPINKEIKIIKFQYLDLYVKNYNSYNDFRLDITITNFIIKTGVIEVTDATIVLEHHDTQWTGKIKSVAKIIENDRKYNCFIEYTFPSTKYVGNLLIKNLSEYLELETILKIFQLENVFNVPALNSLFKHAKILEISVDLANSDDSDFIIQELSIILWTKDLELGSLAIDQLKIYILYSSSRNITDSAIWKFSIEGNVDSLVAMINYDNEKSKMQATLVPTKSKTLNDMVDLLTTTTISSNPMFDEVRDSEITSVDLIINIDTGDAYIEEFSILLMKKLSHGKMSLDDLEFKYRKSNNDYIASDMIFILKATISRQLGDDKISATVAIDCGTEYDNGSVKAYITSPQKPLLLSDLLKLLVDNQPDLQELLP
ncbi:3098_t:CDS:1, partial [Dentiscutata heterogama]